MVAGQFHSWADVLAAARRGEPLYYQAPLDYRPTKLEPCQKRAERGWRCPPYSYQVYPSSKIRIWPPGSNLRSSDPNRADPFTADAGHLDRFRRSTKENPTHPTSDAEHLRNTALVVGGATLIGIIGYAIWKWQQPATALPAATYNGTTLGPGGASAPIGSAATVTGTPPA